MLGKYLIINKNDQVAATLMACYQRFYIWTSVSGRWFEIFSLLCSNPAQGGGVLDTTLCDEVCQ